MWIIYISVIALVIGAAEFGYALNWSRCTLHFFARKFQTRQKTPVQLVCDDNVQLVCIVRKHVYITLENDIEQTDTLTSKVIVTINTTFQVNKNAFIEYIPQPKFCTLFCDGFSIEMANKKYSIQLPHAIKQRKDTINEYKVILSEKLGFKSDKKANYTIYYETFKDFMFRKLSDSFQNASVQYRYCAFLYIVGASVLTLLFATVKTVMYCETYLFTWAQSKKWNNLQTLFMVFLLTCTTDAKYHTDHNTAIQPSMEPTANMQPVNYLHKPTSQTEKQDMITFSSVITDGQIKLESMIRSETVNNLESSQMSTAYQMLKESSIVSEETYSVNQISNVPLFSSTVITSSSVITLASIYNLVSDVESVHSRHLDQSSATPFTYEQLAYSETFPTTVIPDAGDINSNANLDSDTIPRVPEQQTTGQTVSVNSKPKQLQEDTALEQKENLHERDQYTSTLDNFYHYSKIANIDATQTFGATSDNTIRIVNVVKIFKTDSIEEHVSLSFSSENMDVLYSSFPQTISSNPPINSLELDSIDQTMYESYTSFVSHSPNTLSQYSVVLQLNSSLTLINHQTEHSNLQSTEQVVLSSYPTSKDLNVLSEESDVTFDINNYFKSLHNHDSLETSRTLYSNQPSNDVTGYDSVHFNSYSYNNDHSYLPVYMESSTKYELKANKVQTKNLLRDSFRVGVGSDSTSLEQRASVYNSHTQHMSAEPLNPSYKPFISSKSNSESTEFQISSSIVELISDKVRSHSLSNMSTFAPSGVTSLVVNSQSNLVQTSTFSNQQTSLHSHSSVSNPSYTNQQSLYPLVSTILGLGEQQSSDTNYLRSSSPSIPSQQRQKNSNTLADKSNNVYPLHVANVSQTIARDKKQPYLQLLSTSHEPFQFSSKVVHQTTSFSVPSYKFNGLSIIEDDLSSTRISQLQQGADVGIEETAENNMKTVHMETYLSSVHFSISDINQTTTFSTIYSEDKTEDFLQQSSWYIADSDEKMNSLNIFEHSLLSLKTHPLPTDSSNVLISPIPTPVPSFPSISDNFSLKISHSDFSSIIESEMPSMPISEHIVTSFSEIVPSDFEISEVQITHQSSKITSEIVISSQTVSNPVSTYFRTPFVELKHSTTLQTVPTIQSNNSPSEINFEVDRSGIENQIVSKSLLRSAENEFTSSVSTSTQTSTYFQQSYVIPFSGITTEISPESDARSRPESFIDTIDTQLSPSMHIERNKNILESTQSSSQIPLSVSQSHASFTAKLEYTSIVSNPNVLTVESIAEIENTTVISPVGHDSIILSSAPDFLFASVLISTPNYFISSKTPLDIEPSYQPDIIYSSTPIQTQISHLYRNSGTLASSVSQSASTQSPSSVEAQNSHTKIWQTFHLESLVSQQTSDISFSVTSSSRNDFLSMVDTSDIYPVTSSSIQSSHLVDSMSPTLSISSAHQSLSYSISTESAYILSPSYVYTGPLLSVETNDVASVTPENFTNTDISQESSETFKDNTQVSITLEMLSTYVPRPDKVVSELSTRKSMPSDLTFSITETVGVVTTNLAFSSQSTQDDETSSYTLQSSIGSESYFSLLSDSDVFSSSVTALHLLRSTNLKDIDSTFSQLPHQYDDSQVPSGTPSELKTMFEITTPTSTGSHTQSVNTFKSLLTTKTKETELVYTDESSESASSNYLISLTPTVNKAYEARKSSPYTYTSFLTDQNLFSSFSTIPFSDWSLETPTLQPSIQSTPKLYISYVADKSSSETELRSFVFSEKFLSFDKLQTSAAISNSVQYTRTVSSDKSNIDISDSFLLQDGLSYSQITSSTSSLPLSDVINHSPVIKQQDSISLNNVSFTASDSFYPSSNETIMSIESLNYLLISISEISSNEVSSISLLNQQITSTYLFHIDSSHSPIHSDVLGLSTHDISNVISDSTDSPSMAIQLSLALPVDSTSFKTSHVSSFPYQDTSLKYLSTASFVSYGDESLYKGEIHSLFSASSPNNDNSKEQYSAMKNNASTKDNFVDVSTMFSSYQTEHESPFLTDPGSTEVQNSYSSIDLSTEIYSFQPFSRSHIRTLSTSFTNLPNLEETQSSQKSNLITDSLSSYKQQSSTFTQNYPMTPYLTNPPSKIILEPSSFVSKLSDMTPKMISSTNFQYIPHSDDLKSTSFNSYSQYSLSSNRMFSTLSESLESLSQTDGINHILPTSTVGSVSAMRSIQSALSADENEQSMHIYFTNTNIPGTNADHSSDIILNVNNSVQPQNKSDSTDSPTPTLVQDTNEILQLTQALSNTNSFTDSLGYGISSTLQITKRDSNYYTTIFTASTVNNPPVSPFAKTEYSTTQSYTSSSYRISDVQAKESAFFSEFEFYSKSKVLLDSADNNNLVGSMVSNFDTTSLTISSSILGFLQTSRANFSHAIQTSFAEPILFTTHKALETVSKANTAVSENPTNGISERTFLSISPKSESTISSLSMLQQSMPPQSASEKLSDSSNVAASLATLSIRSKNWSQFKKSTSAENVIVSDTLSIYDMKSQLPENSFLWTSTDSVSASPIAKQSLHETWVPSFTEPLTSQSILSYDTEDTTQVQLETSYHLPMSFSKTPRHSLSLTRFPTDESYTSDLRLLQSGTLTPSENSPGMDEIGPFSKSSIKLYSSTPDLVLQSSKFEASSITESHLIFVDPVISATADSELSSSDYLLETSTGRSEKVSELTMSSERFSSIVSSIDFEQVSADGMFSSIIDLSITSKQVLMSKSSVSISTSPVENLSSTTYISTTIATPTIPPVKENIAIIGIQVKLTTDLRGSDFVHSVELGLLKCYMEGLERDGNHSPRERRQIFEYRNKRGSHASIEVVRVERRTEDTTDVDVRFYVIDGGYSLTAKAAEIIFNRLSLVEMSALLGYPVARKVVALVSPSTLSPPPAEPFFTPVTIVLIVVPVTLVIIAGIILLCLYCGEPSRSQRTSVPWSISSLRKPTLDDFDLMIDFENGKVVQRGTPTKQTNYVNISDQPTNALSKDISALQKTLSGKHSVKQKEDRMQLVGFQKSTICETALDEPSISGIQTSTVIPRPRVHGKDRKETNNLKSKIDNIYDGRNRNKPRKCHAHIQVCEGQLGLNIPLNSPDVIPENIGTLYKNDNNDSIDRAENAYWRDTKQRNSGMAPILTKNESYEVVSETSGIDNDVSDTESFDSKQAYVSGEETDDCNDNDVDLSIRTRTEMRVYQREEMIDNSDSVDDIMRQLRERSPLCKISNGSFRASRLQKHRRSAIMNREFVFQGQNDQSSGPNRRHSSTDHMPYSTSRAPKLPVQGYCDKILQKPFYSSLTLGKVPRQVNNFIEGDLEDDVFLSGDAESRTLNQTSLRSASFNINTDMTTPSSVRPTNVCTVQTEYAPLKDASSPDYCVPWDVLGLRFQRQFGSPDGQHYTDGSEYAGDEFESVNFKNEYKKRGRKKNIDQLGPFNKKDKHITSEMFQHPIAPDMLDPVTKMSRVYSRQASPKVEIGPQFRPLQVHQIRAQPKREPSRTASPIESFKPLPAHINELLLKRDTRAVVSPGSEDPRVILESPDGHVTEERIDDLTSAQPDRAKTHCFSVSLDSRLEPEVTPEPQMEIDRPRVTGIPFERRINMQPYEISNLKYDHGAHY